MKTTFKKTEELIKDKRDCPLPLEIIPNNMGINLVAVDGISWQRQDDGQLTMLTIHFIPSTDKPMNEENPEWFLQASSEQIKRYMEDNGLNTDEYKAKKEALLKKIEDIVGGKITHVSHPQKFNIDSIEEGEEEK